jgi:chitinase
MKNIIAILLVALALSSGCSSQRGASPGQVHVSNGDFETGAVTPWASWLAVQPSVTSEKSHNGKFSLAELSDGNGSVYQDVSGLEPGAEYTVSAWTSGQPATTAAAQIAVYDASANISTLSPAIVPTTEWQVVKRRTNASSTGVIRVHLFHNQGNGPIFWDDVEVTRVQ